MLIIKASHWCLSGEIYGYLHGLNSLGSNHENRLRERVQGILTQYCSPQRIRFPLTFSKQLMWQDSMKISNILAIWVLRKIPSQSEGQTSCWTCQESSGKAAALVDQELAEPSDSPPPMVFAFPWTPFGSSLGLGVDDKSMLTCDPTPIVIEVQIWTR